MGEENLSTSLATVAIARVAGTNKTMIGHGVVRVL
jgi:hypothetical protein